MRVAICIFYLCLLSLTAMASHRLAEDEFDDLFDATPEEEELLKTRQKATIKIAGQEDSEVIQKPK
jgi:hypothetical protein